MFYPSVDSTMDEMRTYVSENREDYRHGDFIHAAFQSQGKGRRTGRKWQSQAGKNILGTLLLNPHSYNFPITILPLALGLAVVKLLRNIKGIQNKHIKLKWPNDVLLNGKKIAGILCDQIDGWVHAGIGININQMQFVLEKNIFPATSLAQELAKPFDILTLTSQLLTHIKDIEKMTSWHSEIETILWRLNEKINYKEPLGSIVKEGILRGIGNMGELQIESHSQLNTFFAIELQPEQNNGEKE